MSPEPLIVEQEVLSCYEWFFTQGTPHLLAGALQLIRLKLLDRKIKQIEHYELTKASLGYLVELLTNLDLPFPTS